MAAIGAEARRIGQEVTAREQAKDREVGLPSFDGDAHARTGMLFTCKAHQRARS